MRQRTGLVRPILMSCAFPFVGDSEIIVLSRGWTVSPLSTARESRPVPNPPSGWGRGHKGGQGDRGGILAAVPACLPRCFALRRRQAALHFRAYRRKVHEPRFEKGAGHLLQRLAHAPVQFNLVVQCAQDVGNGALFGEWSLRRMGHMRRIGRAGRKEGAGSRTPDAAAPGQHLRTAHRVCSAGLPALSSAGTLGTHATDWLGQWVQSWRAPGCCLARAVSRARVMRSRKPPSRGKSCSKRRSNWSSR